MSLYLYIHTHPPTHTHIHTHTGKLCYYEAEFLEEVDNRRKPRGVFDLTSRGVSYVLHDNIPKQGVCVGVGVGVWVGVCV